MTTHVFIVDHQTFPCHLRYLFAGTGAKDKDVDFNNNADSVLYDSKHSAAERGLVAMMADCCRVRKGDYVIFYLQATAGQEGRFYGVFQVSGEPFLDRFGNQYLLSELGKNLTFRVPITPYQVYAKGITEWQALDEIRNISSPNQMLWSLIYRKLKGNRGNTMITIYESERLIDLIRRENNYVTLPNSPSFSFFDNEIRSEQVLFSYSGRKEAFNILPRLTALKKANRACESHLQMYLAQNIGRNNIIDEALGINKDSVEWIGNEVSCGVGMQRIDIMLSLKIQDTEKIVMPIELKDVPASPYNLDQISRYINWIEQYYIPNRPSIIQPVLICTPGGLDCIKQNITNFNNLGKSKYLPLIYIEYSLTPQGLIFQRIQY